MHAPFLFLIPPPPKRNVNECTTVAEEQLCRVLVELFRINPFDFCEDRLEKLLQDIFYS